MTVQLPSALPPRWATSAPGNTITEPTEPEKDAGFQPGSQAQVEDFVIANVLNSHAYTAQVNGNLATYNSPSSGNTATTIGAGLAAAIAGLGEPVTATGTSNAARVTASVAGQAFTVATTDGPNVTVNHITPNRTGKPIRQYVNWFFNWAYQWLIFFYYAMFQWSDLVTNTGMDVSGGTPSIGSGLVDNTGTSAVAYIPTPASLVRRAVGVPEAKTYTDNKDTYLFLHYDGSWSYSEVANSAAAPATPAYSRPQSYVRTVGGDRTLAVSLQNRTKVMGSSAWSWSRLFHNPSSLPSGSGTSIDTQTPPLAITSSTGNYEEVVCFPQTAGAGDARFYSTSFGFLVAIGCYFKTSDSKWYFDQGALDHDPSHASVYFLNYSGSFWAYTKTVTGANTSTSWTDSQWTDQGLGAFGRLHDLGGGLVDTLAHVLLPRISTPTSGTPSDFGGRVLLWEVPGDTSHRRLYFSHTGALSGPCLEDVWNAAWDGANWVQDESGDSHMDVRGRQGFAQLSYVSASPTTFPTSSWSLLQTVAGATIHSYAEHVLDNPAFPNDVTFDGAISAGGGIFPTVGSPTAGVSLWHQNTIKARGQIVFSAGGIASFDGYNIGTPTFAVVGGDAVITVPFTTDWGTNLYAVTYGSKAVIGNGFPLPSTLVKSNGNFTFKIYFDGANSFASTTVSGWVIDFVVV